MKTIQLKQLSLFLVLLPLCVVLFGTGCEKEESAQSHAKGTIIAVTEKCYGETVLIEVEEPKGIGSFGNFFTLDRGIDISYKNTISVPYFSKIGIPDSVPQIVGTWLYFEYRELTEEERKNSHLFSDPTLVCPAIYSPPAAQQFIITEILKYE
jgi:hypothetical protein